MLSQLERLSLEVDGRYATDGELQFLTDYAQSFPLRVQTYRKLQEIEVTLMQQAYIKLRTLDPTVFKNGKEDLSGPWKRDTLRTLRYTAMALLLNDSDTLKESYLLWFQTIMRAFGTEQRCNLTYGVLQDVAKQLLSAPEANLYCPLLELNRQMLSIAA